RRPVAKRNRVDAALVDARQLHETATQVHRNPRPNCANPGFGRATVSGYFALAAPGLGRPVLVRSAPVHFLPGPSLDEFAGVGSLLAHCVRTGPVDAFSQAGPEPGQPVQPAPGQLARALRARPLPVNLAWPPRLRIPSTRLGLAVERSRWPAAEQRSRLDSDRQVRKLQQFLHAPARRLSSSPNP